ncbi:hypothetical protein ZIOFF_038200 [Zingiber officinale]|uniref:valine--tRNA ligase n=1 Tax=Zingiber officinale TaxID=94328 RepID=A0A8J5GLR7_ZINOF|nr:hypothetical protein ZIOFF_038200 [Zingiber officinale]
MAFSSPSLLSSRSIYLINPVLFSPSARRFGARPRRWNLCRPNRKFLSVMATENEVFTSPEVAKSFDFASEERIYSWWEAQGFFKPSFDRRGDPFVIPMPPPNVTGSLHMGHAMFVTLEDIMVRYNRMKGRPTLWIPGTDHAGIATQLVVEKLLASEGIKRSELSREEFTKRVWEWKEKYGGTITSQIRRLGASCDWTREHFTLDEQLSRAVVEAFVKLHEKELIYQASQVPLTSGQRASGCSVSAAPCISSFAITSASPASSLFLHAGGSQPAVAPTTLSGASNNLFSFSSKPKDTGLSVLEKSAKTFPGVTDTEFGGIPRTQVLSGTSLISSSWPNQSQSSCSSTIGMNISSSSGLGSSPIVTTHTNSKLLIPTSSFPMGSGLSSPSTDAAATATTSSPLATSSNVLGLNSQPPTLPASSLFAASASSESSGFAFATPFIFNSTSNLASSFSPAASTSISSRHPTFGLQNSAVGVSTSGDNEMSIEESMNGDNNQSAGNMFQQFGQPGSAAAPAFSAPAAQSASPFFQFASKQNPPLPSSAPPQFQPSGSMELPQGGSFAMGSGGGGGDKSSRRIIKVRKDKMRKR